MKATIAFTTFQYQDQLMNRQLSKTSRMHRFLVEPQQRFAGANTRIKKPTVCVVQFMIGFNIDSDQEIAYFSYDSEHVLKPLDNESLRYYYPPFFNIPGHQDSRFPVDLSKGYDSFRSRDDSADEHLDGLLDTLVEAEKRNGEKTKVDLVTWRGMMTRVCLHSQPRIP